ncbi:SDR family oxidoreductase [Streptomyces sp. CHD11]|uniref:SDR family oxidoreductase n=1 Tax=Streptomyces sp. CHD11 TaxID=2741325 RepID=UPI001BFC873E|nr:SDR family oxidoreductase [Streptomyces sp. CHD11]MBT3149497.1 SDR family oxidoreductase [Streptomyces sp. CHD11]
MKIVVIGGTGLIGSKLVEQLKAQGHEAVPAAPNTGVNTLTGEGLSEVLQGAPVVVDVSNSPSWADDAVMEFFRTSTTNLLKAEAEAGATHHVALSVVGTDRLQESGYFRAKQAQENLIKESGMPYSIVHATQFFEFMKGIADLATEGDTVRLSPAGIQPILSDDVAAAVGRTAVGAPVDAVVEIAGPEAFPLDELIRRTLAARNDPRTVVTDPQARYSGAPLEENTLLPGPGAHLAETRYTDWLAQQS